jgi:hypothetical protein
VARPAGNGSEFFVVHFKNLGKAPAVQVEVYVSETWTARSTPIKSIPIKESFGYSYQPEVFAANAIGNISTANMPIPPVAVQDIKSEATQLFINGTISYYRFGVRHSNRFSYLALPDLSLVPGPASGASYNVPAMSF